MTVSSRTTHEVSKDGNLYFLLNAFIGAYNRRTDVLAHSAALLGGGLEAIALALSSEEDNSAEIAKLTDQVRASREALQAALDNQPGAQPTTPTNPTTDQQQGDANG